MEQKEFEKSKLKLSVHTHNFILFVNSDDAVISG